jgi:uncharacterized protein (DUF433 family)
MLDRITVRPTICFGKPVIKGTRIPVHMVLDLLEEGCSPEEIITDFYPDLSVEDVRACIHYANALVKNEDVHIVATEAVLR